jgi:hypothetical protein
MSNHGMFTLKGTLNGAQIRNIFYISGGGFSGNEQAIVDYIRTVFNNRLLAQTVNNLQYYGVDVRDVGTPSLPTIEYSFTSGAWTGTGTAQSLPNQVAALVNFRANVAKPNLSRKFIAGMTNAGLNDDGSWSTAYVAALQAWGNDMIAIGSTISGVGIASVQWSGDNTYVTGANIMTFAQVGLYPSTQRRRKPGVGI